MFAKHDKITRPNYGAYGRVEYAVLGTKCGIIQELCQKIAQQLTNKKTAYLDADHGSVHNDKNIDSPFCIKYTDQITHHRFEQYDKINHFQQKKAFNDCDLILVNGNHFKAKKQVVILDPEKEKSLYKRRDQLTDIVLFITMTATTYFPPFLDELHPNARKIRQLNIRQTDEIVSFFSQLLVEEQAPLYGLVLAGGKSRRMGEDKGKINIKGQDARRHLYGLLNRVCDQTYISGRSDQKQEISSLPFIPDRMYQMGPFGAIITAFMHNPNVAWLVVATDLMLLEPESLEQLVKGRDTSKIATAFHNEATGFPDPLCTIWEPKSYAHLLEFMRLGYSCPRKVLINSDLCTIEPANSQWLFNVNTPEDLNVLSQIKNTPH